MRSAIDDVAEAAWLDFLQAQRGVARAQTAAAWDESKHPRDPSGTETGGQFTTVAAPVMGEGPKGRRDQIELLNSQNPMGLDQRGKDRVEQELADSLDGMDLQMRMPEAAFLEVFRDGEFYNQYQSGAGRGMPRDLKSEASMLGLPMETTAEEMPKYGYIGPETEYVTMYGPVKVILKDEVKDRATFATGDTLMQNVVPSPIRNPWWGSAEGYIDLLAGSLIPSWEDEALSSSGYIEAQIYGKLTPADIKSVEILDESYWGEDDPVTGAPLVDSAQQMEAVIAELDRRGIPWSTYVPEGDYSGEWAA